MAGRFSRWFRALVTVVAIAVTALLAGLAPANAAGSAPNKPPTGQVQKLGVHFDRYCVKHFKANSTVKVVNELTGAVAYIHTNDKGAGCVEVPIKVACHAVTQKFVATGRDQDGDPATATSTVTTPGDHALCQNNSGGILPFTGSNYIVPGVVIGLLLVVVGGLLNVRRRRTG